MRGPEELRTTRRRFLAGAAATTAALVAACARREPGAHLSGADLRTLGGAVELRYGDDPWQVVDLWPPRVPSADAVPVVVLVHGGFWRPAYDRRSMDPLASAVQAQGWAAWNVEYRPLGEGGGWPATYLDVAAAVDLIAAEDGPNRLDPGRVVVVGHSAGGTLALWSAARDGLPADAPGADPAVHPVLAASLAGVNNLIAARIERLGQGVVEEFMGAPPTGAEDAYALASPSERLPIGVPQFVQYGTDDAVVPPRQSTAYAAKATEAGDTVELSEVEGAGHFDLLRPTGPGWQALRDAIAGAVA